MPKSRWLVVVVLLAVLGAGLAAVVGTHMPSEFLPGVNRSLAVTLLGMAPVVLVAVVVGCVLVYRKLVSFVSGATEPGPRRPAPRRRGKR
jgi:hypothetical protein